MSDGPGGFKVPEEYVERILSGEQFYTEIKVKLGPLALLKEVAEQRGVEITQELLNDCCRTRNMAINNADAKRRAYLEEYCRKCGRMLLGMPVVYVDDMPDYEIKFGDFTITNIDGVE